MATPVPTSPGDAREDHAQRVAAAAGDAVARAELVMVATIAMLAKRVATGSMPLNIAQRRLARTAAAVLAASVQRALLGDAQATDALTPALDAAIRTATAAAHEALAAAASVAGGSAAPPDRIQTTQKALDALAAAGLTGFLDKAGRRWNLAAYVETATRAVVSSAWDERQAAGLIRAGVDLVVVGTHSTEGSCAKCRPWLGRTLSLTGATPGFPTLADAKAAGFRHPHCRCGWGAPGTLTPVPSPADLARSAAAYEASQRKRALERRTRAAHRRVATAVTPQARTAARRELGLIRADFTRRQYPFQER